MSVVEGREKAYQDMLETFARNGIPPLTREQFDNADKAMMLAWVGRRNNRQAAYITGRTMPTEEFENIYAQHMKARSFWWRLRAAWSVLRYGRITDV